MTHNAVMPEATRECNAELQRQAEKLSKLMYGVKADEATQKKLQRALDAILGEQVVRVPERRALN